MPKNKLRVVFAVYCFDGWNRKNKKIGNYKIKTLHNYYSTKSIECGICSFYAHEKIIVTLVKTKKQRRRRKNIFVPAFMTTYFIMNKLL